MRQYLACYQNLLKAQMKNDYTEFRETDICTKKIPNSSDPKNGAKVIDMLGAAKRTLALFEFNQIDS